MFTGQKPVGAKTTQQSAGLSRRSSILRHLRTICVSSALSQSRRQLKSYATVKTLSGGGDGPEGPRQGDRARGQQEAGAVAMMALRASVRALRDLEEELAVQGTRMAVVLREKERLEEQLQEATDTVEVWQ